MEGLISDAREHVQEIEAVPALDTVLIGAVQKTEHYCMAAWGTVKALGEALGQKEIARAMERALKEGKRYDEELTQLAESEVTPALLAEGAEVFWTCSRGNQEVFPAFGRTHDPPRIHHRTDGGLR